MMNQGSPFPTASLPLTRDGDAHFFYSKNQQKGQQPEEEAGTPKRQNLEQLQRALIKLCLKPPLSLDS